MNEPMEAINPVFEIVAVVGFGLIVRLASSPRETVRAMRSPRDMDEFEVKREYCEDPAIDARTGRDVRVLQHTFDVPSIDLDDEVANSYKVEA